MPKVGSSRVGKIDGSDLFRNWKHKYNLKVNGLAAGEQQLSPFSMTQHTSNITFAPLAINIDKKANLD